MHKSITRLLELEPSTDSETPGVPHAQVPLSEESVLAPRVLSSVGQKAQYLSDDEEVGVEECVARHYRKQRWNARVVQNQPWLALRDFLFMDLTHVLEEFGDEHFRYLDLLYPQNYDRGTGNVYLAGGIVDQDAKRIRAAFDIEPGGLLHVKTLGEIVGHVCKVRDCGLQRALEEGFATFRQRAQIDFQIKQANPEMLETCRWLIAAVAHDNILAILARTICGNRDVDAGFPDVIAYNEDETRFVEVKSPGDSLRESQKRFHSFVSQKLGVSVVICNVRDSNADDPEYQEAVRVHREQQVNRRAHQKAIKQEIAQLLDLNAKQITKSLRLQYGGTLLPSKLKLSDYQRAAGLFNELGHWWNAQSILTRGIAATSSLDRLHLRTQLGEFWAERGVKHKALKELLLVLASDPGHERARAAVRKVYEDAAVPAEASRVLDLGTDELADFADRVAFHEYWSDLGVALISN